MKKNPLLSLLLLILWYTGWREDERYKLLTPLMSLSSFTLHDSRLPTQSSSNWMSVSLYLPGLQPNARHRMLSDWPSLCLLCFHTPSLCAPVSRCSLPKTLLLLHTPAAPQQFLAYQMTLGLKASCQTWYETGSLLGDLIPHRTPRCTQGPSCFIESISLFHGCTVLGSVSLNTAKFSLIILRLMGAWWGFHIFL